MLEQRSHQLGAAVDHHVAREVVEPERLVFTLSDQPGDDAYS